MKFFLSAICGLFALQTCAAQTFTESHALLALQSKLPDLETKIENGIAQFANILSGPQQNGNSILENFLSNLKEQITNASDVSNAALSVCPDVQDAISELEDTARHEISSCIIVATSAIHASQKDLKGIQPIVKDLITSVNTFASHEATCDPFDIACKPASISPLVTKVGSLAQRVEKANKKAAIANGDTLAAKVGRCASNALAALSDKVGAVVEDLRQCINSN